MDRGDDNLRVATQGIRKVAGIAVIVHDLYLAALMLNPQNGLLKLAVNHNAVSNDQHRIKNVVVRNIVDRR